MMGLLKASGDLVVNLSLVVQTMGGRQQHKVVLRVGGVTENHL